MSEVWNGQPGLDSQ